MIDQDEAARPAGEEAKETQREQVKVGLQGGRKAGPLRRGGSGYWRGCRGGQWVLGGCTAEIAVLEGLGLGEKF